MASSWNVEPLDPIAVGTVARFMTFMRAISPRNQIRCLRGLQLSLDDQDASFSPDEVAIRRECLHELHLLLRQRI